MTARAGAWYEKAVAVQRDRDGVKEHLPDLEAVRDRILSGLGVGKQSPQYKRTKAVLDGFIEEVKK